MCNIISKELKYPNPESKGKRWRYTFECEKCGVITDKWYQKSTWNCLCRHCGKGGFNKEEFIIKSKEKHGDRYDYTDTVYKNKRTKVSIRCPKHGVFEQRAGDHMDGYNCPKCGQESQQEKKTVPLNVWKERLADLYPNVTIVSYDKTGYDSPVTLSCSKHGVFDSKFSLINPYKNHICPDCRKLVHQKQSIRSLFLGKKAILYYVYLVDYNCYKLGITTQKLSQRLSRIRFVEIYKKEYTYTEAIEIEHNLHTKLTEYRLLSKEIIFPHGGNNELYATNVLTHILNITKGASEK